MQYKQFTLDPFQEQAIKAVDNGSSVVVSAPTGSGKTLIADYIIDKYLKKGAKVIYTAPIKALSNQKFKDFSEEYGKENIGLLTGDIVINPQAPILIMTTEIYRNMVLADDPFLKQIFYVIFDEVHYINDIERGYVWEESIIFSKEKVRFLALSATIPNAVEFADWIRAIKKHEVVVVENHKRNVPLHRAFYDTELGITELKKIKEADQIPDYDYYRGRKRGRRRRQKVKAPNHIDLVKEIKDKLPCFFFTFSRHKCQTSALALSKANLFPKNPKITSIMSQKLSEASPEIQKLKSTQTLRQTLPFGIGFHHAGLLPIIKELVEELFGQGLIKVLYTTETFAVGINMPAKTVCFEGLRKFDGINFRFLNSKEYFQMAGRAGRRGIDKEGFAYAMVDRRDFDYGVLKKMTDADLDPIKSQFRLSVNTVLNLIDQHDEKEIDIILKMNFFTFQKYGVDFEQAKKNRIYFTFNNIRKKLLKMKYIEKDNTLTKKGNFSARIYADEIVLGEIFATDFFKYLDEYQILMLLACLSYEAKERTQFYQLYPSEKITDLKTKIGKSEFLHKEKRFLKLKQLTAMIDPIYNGKTIFDIMKNTNLQEGDVIRFLRQILDRIGQIRKATDNERLVDMMDSITKVVLKSMEEIEVL